jgi:cytochrome c553
MCRAAGFVRDVPTDLRRASAEFSSVVVPAAINHSGTAEQIGRGATLALQCTMCHGAAGLSAADSPNLAGQYSDVVYKQLIDYQRGSRANVVMTGLAETLSEENIVDLAYYYAYLPRTGSNASVEGAPALVRVGDPIRNIAPCGSCHGNMQRKAGAPWLNGEPLVYLEDQLLAFHSDTRRNDVNAVMRSVAYRMTSQEITDLAHYYASLSP